ncbi:MAG: tetratricopeptide repeat protein [Chitinophagaceae bacterium]|nr:tetratricopeptide repeat protein [Chitinophagaceae bacterium]
MKKIIILCLVLFSLSAQSQKAVEAIKKGNDHYKEKLFVKAAEEYNRAIQIDPSDQIAKFNLANAFYKQDNKVDAAQILTGITNTAKEKGLLSKAFYNKGVILSRQKNLEASIEAYKNALRNDPNDKQARENLQKALLELKKKTPPPPKKKEQEKKKQQQQQKQPQSKLDQKEAEQRLKLLEQKEKQTQQKMQSERSKSAASTSKDW